MASLIGFMMTQFPYAAAALALSTDLARDRFARISEGNTHARPETILRRVRHETTRGRFR